MVRARHSRKTGSSLLSSVEDVEVLLPTTAPQPLTKPHQQQRSVPSNTLLEDSTTPNGAIIASTWSSNTVEGSNVLFEALAITFWKATPLHKLFYRFPTGLDPHTVVPHIVWQLCRVLKQLHEVAGVVHLDVKLSNVLLDEQGRVLLVDFGSAAQLLPEGDDSSSSSCKQTATRWKGLPWRDGQRGTLRASTGAIL